MRPGFEGSQYINPVVTSLACKQLAYRKSIYFLQYFTYSVLNFFRIYFSIKLIPDDVYSLKKLDINFIKLRSTKSVALILLYLLYVLFPIWKFSKNMFLALILFNRNQFCLSSAKTFQIDLINYKSIILFNLNNKIFSCSLYK